MISNLDSYNLIKVFVIAHFCLSTLAMFGHWLPFSYAWSQSFIVILGLWSIMSETNKVEPLKMLSLGLVASVVLDSIAIGISWEYGNLVDRGGLHGFTGSMAIILLIFKPIFAFFSYRYANELTSGGESPAFGNWANGPTSNQTSQQGGYNSTGGYQA